LSASNCATTLAILTLAGAGARLDKDLKLALGSGVHDQDHNRQANEGRNGEAASSAVYSFRRPAASLTPSSALQIHMSCPAVNKSALAGF
jgi:hypothetical protein